MRNGFLCSGMMAEPVNKNIKKIGTGQALYVFQNATPSGCEMQLRSSFADLVGVKDLKAVAVLGMCRI
jgi:hypothetical protein